MICSRFLVVLAGFAGYFATDVSFRDAQGAESARLTTVRHAPDRIRVVAELEASGKLRLNADGRGVQDVPISIAGRVEYRNAVLDRNGDGRETRAIRHYDKAEGKIHIRKWEIETSLNASRRLVGVERRAGQRLIYYSPLGPLTAQDLDVVSLQFDPLLMDDLVPDRTVEPGDSWKVPPTLLVSLFGLDAILESDVRTKVAAIEPEVVRLELEGELEGTVDGVTSRIELRGKIRWDRSQQRVTWVAVRFREQRDISHAAPGFDTTARLRMAIQPHDRAVVSDKALRQRVATGPGKPELLLAVVSPSGFELLHGRQWKLVVDGPDATVLRMVAGGELIAQCNVSRLVDGKPISLAEFQRDVRQALGDRFRQWVVAEATEQGDTRRLHLVAAGETGGLSIQWIYYHLHDGRNRRATVSFTIESKLMEQFAGADEQLVATLKLTAPARSQPPTDSGSGDSPKSTDSEPREARRPAESVPRE